MAKDISQTEGQAAVMQRRGLTVAISNLLIETGFESAEEMALETLVEMTQSYITELGNSARTYSELASRTQPMVADVVMALVGMGSKMDGLQAHAMRPNRTVLQPPTASTQPKQLGILQAGVKQPHPSHIPNHLPPFPDPHAYIRTPTHKQPVTEYEAIREKSANQKRDIERALTKFIAKTSDTHNLFDTEENNMFPLIACKPEHPSYIKALLPMDQVFDPEEEFTSPPTRAARAAHDSSAAADGDDDDDDEHEAKEGEGRAPDGDAIDNPYLRAVKMPKK